MLFRRQNHFFMKIENREKKKKNESSEHLLPRYTHPHSRVSLSRRAGAAGPVEGQLRGAPPAQWEANLEGKVTGNQATRALMASMDLSAAELAVAGCADRDDQGNPGR